MARTRNVTRNSEWKDWIILIIQFSTVSLLQYRNLNQNNQREWEEMQTTAHTHTHTHTTYTEAIEGIRRRPELKRRHGTTERFPLRILVSKSIQYPIVVVRWGVESTPKPLLFTLLQRTQLSSTTTTSRIPWPN